MRYTFKIVFIMTLVCALVAGSFAQKHPSELSYGKLGKVKIPDYKMATLDNGMKVILVEDHELPFIKMRAQFLAGSVWGVPDDKVGLASLTGTVMRSGGTESVPGDSMDADLEKIAASVETWIGDVSGGASANTLKDHFDMVSHMFADVLRKPVFPQEKIDLAKVSMRSSISRRNDDATQIARREFYQIIYKNSRLWRDTEYETVNNITREDIVKFHEKWVRPNGMVLAVWGDFKKGDMLKKIEKLFGDWQPKGEAVFKAPDVDYIPEFSVNLVEKNDVNQSNIYIGHLGGTKDNPDYPDLVMMNEILSGGFSSRLFSRVRSDQGLAYAVYGSYGTNFSYPGAFFMHSRTQSGRTVEAIRSMLKEMRLMTEEKVGEEELEVAMEGWLNSYVFNFDSVDEIVRRLITYTYYGYPHDFLQKTRNEIEEVTRDDVLRVAQKYLDPYKVHILVVGKPADFDTTLSVLGEVNQIDISIPQPEEEKPEATEETTAKGVQLMHQMVDAIGGMENITATENVQVETHSTQQTPMGKMDIDGKVTIVYPDKFAAIMNTPGGQVKLILNGDQAQMIGPQGSQPAPPPMKKNLQGNLMRDMINVAKTLDEFDIQYVGETTFVEKPAEEILLSKGDQSFRLFLDPDSQLPLGISYTQITQQGPTKTQEQFLDLRTVNGVKFHFKTIGYSGGEKSSETEIKTLNVNTNVDMSLFEM